MARIEKHNPGDFCWLELATTDAAAAKAFYGAVFGWSPADIPMGDAGVYTMWKLEDLELGAMYQLSGEQAKQGIPPHWMIYVAVTSTDDAIAKAVQAGGKVLMGPHDVPGAGRMAVLLDPAGAVFAVWEARGHIGSRIGDTDGVMTWSELATSDAAKAKEFYKLVFGWGSKAGDAAGMEYTEWINAGRPVGGLFQMPGEWRGIPPHWMPYFRVAGCDQTAAKVRENGGQVKVPPTDIPNVGRFAVLGDPQGAVFSIIQMAV
jgi:predicted enzyme related to lactoylglutathione lyase